MHLKSEVCEDAEVWRLCGGEWCRVGEVGRSRRVGSEHRTKRRRREGEQLGSIG
jgi:hypothetical protein